MQKYMVDMVVSGLTQDEIKAIIPAEGAMVRELTEAGVILALYVKADFSGAYVVAQAADPDSLKQELSRLPMYPHMAVTVVPIL